MRRARIALSALCLALMIPLLLHASRILPLDTRPLVAEKYAGWSGVLRLWVYEGWPCGAGSASSWLNRCISRFEKAHPGVYVQPRSVDAGAIAALSDSGILPPDMALFPPGLLDAPQGLLALEKPDALRPELAGLGAWGGAIYAVPVALGGYAWAWNRALLDDIPDDWREAGATPAVAEPEIHRRWDAALLALCQASHARASDGGDATPHVDSPDVDLGLALSRTPAPSAAPAPDSAPAPHRLPEGFAFAGDAWQRFVNGEAAAMPVTQREVRRLQALSGQGRGPDWLLSAEGAPFTDQLLLLGLVDRPDAEAQRALCLEFLNGLLSDESQGELARVGAFGVTNAPSGYDSGDPLAQIDALLRSPSLVAPNAFDGGWADAIGAIVREFASGDGDSTALWRRLAARSVKNPNDPRGSLMN